MLVIHSVIGVLGKKFELQCDTCACALFVIKVHVERSTHFLTQFPSKWQILRKFAKFAVAKVKVVFRGSEDLLKSNPYWSDIRRPRTLTCGHRTSTQARQTFTSPQINAIGHAGHRSHPMHSWLFTILTPRNGCFSTIDNLINRHSQFGKRK